MLIMNITITGFRFRMIRRIMQMSKDDNLSLPILTDTGPLPPPPLVLDQTEVRRAEKNFF